MNHSLSHEERGHESRNRSPARAGVLYPRLSIQSNLGACIQSTHQFRCLLFKSFSARGYQKSCYLSRLQRNTIKLVAGSPGFGQQEDGSFWETQGRYGVGVGTGEGIFYSNMATETGLKGKRVSRMCRDTAPSLPSSHMRCGRPFYDAAYGAFIIEFFIVIDLTCTILLALAKQILTGFDIRTKNMFPTS